MITKQELGAQLAELRKVEGVSIRELAERCEMSKTTIVNIERGAFFPRFDILQKITEALGANIEIKARQ